MTLGTLTFFKNVKMTIYSLTEGEGSSLALQKPPKCLLFQKTAHNFFAEPWSAPDDQAAAGIVARLKDLLKQINDKENAQKVPPNDDYGEAWLMSGEGPPDRGWRGGERRNQGQNEMPPREGDGQAWMGRWYEC